MEYSSSLANSSLFGAQLIFSFAFSWHRACSLESLIYLLCLLPAHFATHLLLRFSLYAMSDLIHVISAITDACTVFCIRCFGSCNISTRKGSNLPECGRITGERIQVSLNLTKDATPFNMIHQIELKIQPIRGKKDR